MQKHYPQLDEKAVLIGLESVNNNEVFFFHFCLHLDSVIAPVSEGVRSLREDNEYECWSDSC